MEAILNHDGAGLQAVKAAIERERAALTLQHQRLMASGALASLTDAKALEDAVAAAAAGTLASAGLLGGSAEARSMAHVDGDLSISLWEDDFDSGAETEIEEGSQVTAMSDSE